LEWNCTVISDDSKKPKLFLCVPPTNESQSIIDLSGFRAIKTESKPKISRLVRMHMAHVEDRERASSS
jgi:hypothetical protein